MRLQLAPVDARLVVVGIGEVVALLLEPGDEVDIRPAHETVQILRAVLRPVERDLDRAAGSGDRVRPAVLVEVERLPAPVVVRLVRRGRDDHQDLGLRRPGVVANDEHDCVLQVGGIGGRELREVHTGGGKRVGRDRVRHLPVAAVVLTGDRVRRIAGQRVVDEDVARGQYLPSTLAPVVAHPEDGDVHPCRIRGDVTADLQRHRLVAVEARFGRVASDGLVVVRHHPGARPRPVTVVLVDDRDRVGARDGRGGLRRSERSLDSETAYWIDECRRSFRRGRTRATSLCVRDGRRHEQDDDERDSPAQQIASPTCEVQSEHAHWGMNSGEAYFFHAGCKFSG